MPCYHPLKAWIKGRTSEGKNNIVKITSLDQDKIFLDGIIYDEAAMETVHVPCGQCSGCRMEYAREWANRLMLERETSDKCYFITLTYDDDYIWEQCRSYRSDPETGEVIGYSLSLQKRDIQLFMKRLRKTYADQKIRFYCAGEYGSKTARPHYHIITFGLCLPLGDLQFYKQNFRGDRMYNSTSLSELWPYGYNVVAEVTWESCCYVARYMMKKWKGPLADVYIENGLEPPFSLMSRRPGIAAPYFEAHPEVMDKAKIVLPSSGDEGYREFPPPRYLERLYSVGHPDEARDRQRVRRLSALNSEKIKLSRTNKSKKDYLEMLENNFTKADNLLYNFREL